MMEVADGIFLDSADFCRILLIFVDFLRTLRNFCRTLMTLVRARSKTCKIRAEIEKNSHINTQPIQHVLDVKQEAMVKIRVVC